MFSSPDKALSYAVDNDFEMVDFTFTDLFGRPHHISIPITAFSEKTFTEGVAFDSSSVPGFKVKGGSDIVLIPDCSTGRKDAFSKFKTLVFTCSTCEAGTLEPFMRDPRNVLKKAQEYLYSLKIADGCYFSPEYEFYILDGIKFTNKVNECSYYIASEEAGWKVGGTTQPGLGNIVPHQSGYHAMPPRDLYYDLRSEMVRRMMDEGINVKYHHHEVGAAGQLEIEVLFEEPLKAADQGMIIKYITRMTAIRNGKTVTYMPKPLHEAAGSGMHFHQFMHKNGKSLFYEKGGYANLSKLGLSYIAGLLSHTPAVMGFTNPSTNSYKRLVPGFEAPTRLFYGLANRSACIRIPKYDDNEEFKRIEFRPGDGTGNIYLMIAAQMLAGVHGITEKMNPDDYDFGPYNEDVKLLPDEVLDKIASVPKDLEEAMLALDSDREFLTSCGAFTDDLIDFWTEFKLREEYYEIRERPHPYEMELYFDL